jgi:hypothetical protein
MSVLRLDGDLDDRGSRSYLYGLFTVLLGHEKHTVNVLLC